MLAGRPVRRRRLFCVGGDMADGTGQPKLTTKQRLFIDFYLGVSQFNATDAARRAGYKFPNTDGPRLLVNVGIQSELESLFSETGASRSVAVAMLVQDATRTDAEILETAAKAPSVPATASVASGLITARTTARTNLAKAAGVLADRLNVKHSGRIDHVHRIPKSIDILTEDELDKLEAIAERVAAQEVTA